MSQELFERYKDVLREGHVAVLRGRLEDAVAAYREALEIAPDRALPRAALGSVQLRLGEPEQALATFEAALSLAPTDDASLVGRAQALVVLLRPEEAAATYDRLADTREAAGLPARAGDAVARALEIEPTPERQARRAQLLAEHRRPAPAEAAEPAEAGSGEQAASPPARRAEDEEGATSGEAGEPTVSGDLEAGAATAGEAAGGVPAEAIDAVAEIFPATALVAHPGPGPVDGARAPLSGSSSDPGSIIAEAEALAFAADEAATYGDAPGAVAAAIASAERFQAAGRSLAALDVCMAALDSGPADISLHLLIAELYVGRGWTALAGDLYRNLVRLSDLDGDSVARERILAAARRSVPGDPRFAS